MPLKQNFDSESFEGKNAVSLPRTNKFFSMLFGSNEVVHHDRLASDEMHHDGGRQRTKPTEHFWRKGKRN